MTIEHARGSTTINSEPQRAVTIGWSDQDPVLALGVQPVSTTEWFNEQSGVIFPWAREAVSGATPEIVSTAGAGGEINDKNHNANRLPDEWSLLFGFLVSRTYSFGED